MKSKTNNLLKLTNVQEGDPVIAQNCETDFSGLEFSDLWVSVSIKDNDL